MSWPDLTIAVFLFGLSLGYFSLSFDRSLELSDEGLILYHSARVAAGEVPYEDFPNTYGPGVFAATGLVLRAFDGQILAVRILLAGMKALAVVLAFLICRPVVSRPFAVLGALLSMVLWGRPAWNLNTPYAALYSIPLCLLACFALVLALRVDSRVRYLVAGLIGGAPILFKQTLGVTNAWGMVLAVCAVTALVCKPAERSRTGGVQFLVVWLIGAIAILLPAARLLRPTDYVLHFLPLHVFMAAVAASVVVRGGCAPLAPAVGHRLAPLVLGMGVLPGLVLGFFSWRGELRALVFNAVTLPATLINYYLPIPLPPLGRCLLLLGAIGLVFTVLLALRGRWPQARLAGLSALVLLFAVAAVHPYDALSTIVGPQTRRPLDSEWSTILGTAPAMLEGAQPAVVLLAATAMLAPSLLVAGRAVPAPLLRTVVPLVLLQAALSFQVFPRGSFNVWLVQGALMPLSMIVLSGWYRVGALPTASIARRTAAAVLVSALPLWMVTPAVHQMVDKLTAPRAGALAFRQARGISLTRLDARLLSASQVEQLVAFLRAAEPAGAPVLPITTDLMVLYLSGRRHVFPELDYYFFLLGLDMLPSAQRTELADDSLVCRLADTPDALIVIRDDQTAVRMLSTLWRLREVMTPDYETIVRVGSYSVLRRKPGAQYPSSCAIRSR